MTLSAFENATQALFDRIRSEPTRTAARRGYVIPAREHAVVTWCTVNDKTEVTVKILQWLAGTIKGMPRFHKTKMKANGRKEDGSVGPQVVQGALHGGT